MDLRFYLAFLLRRKWIILAAFLASVIGVGVGMTLIRPVYSASATLRIATATTGSVDYTNYMYSDRLLNTTAKIATSGPILNALASRLNIPEAPPIKVSTVPNTELLEITADSPDPKLASAAANGLAEILVSRSRALYAGTASSQTQIIQQQLDQLAQEINQARANYAALAAQSPADSAQMSTLTQTINAKQNSYATLLEQLEEARVREALLAQTISEVEPAVVPSRPSQPNPPADLALGGLAGLVAGIALALLIENLNTTSYSRGDFDKSAQHPTLADIPFMNHRDKFVLLNGNSSSGKAIHQLSQNLLRFNREAHSYKVLFTSARRGEGKSTIAASLAKDMGQLGEKVVLIDGDLRLPSLHQIFNLPNLFGLSNALKGDTISSLMLQQTDQPGVTVITGGAPVADPSDVLRSQQMANLVHYLEAYFDLVLVDSPSLLDGNDTISLAQWMDGVILVVQNSRTREETIQEACQKLADCQIMLLGIVINRVKTAQDWFPFRQKARAQTS